MAQEMVLVIRPSFLKVCNGDACTAATFNHVLYWIAKKASQGATSWYAKGEDIWESMSRAWGINTIRNAIRTLVSLNFLGQYHNGYQQIRHYFFGKEQALALFTACKEHNICLWHLDLPDEVTALIYSHLTDLLSPFNKSVKCICSDREIHLTNPLNGFHKSVKSVQRETTKISNKDTSKREYTTRTREILALCAKTLGVALAHTSHMLDLASKIEEAGLDDEAIVASIERMKKSKYWHDRGGVPFNAVAKNIGDEWVIVQQERQQSPSASSTPDFAPNSTQDDIERWKARHAAKKAAIGQ